MEKQIAITLREGGRGRERERAGLEIDLLRLIQVSEENGEEQN